MAKTKTTTHKFYIVDLVRNKPKTQFVEIPPYRVNVEINVTTTGILSASDVPSAAMKRLEDAARAALDIYEKTIATEAARLDAKVVLLMRAPSAQSHAEAEEMIKAINHSIKNALGAAESAANAAVNDRLKKEIQLDKNLKEARVRTGLLVINTGMSLAVSVGKLVATAGADVTSYVSIANTLRVIGTEINQQLKNEDKLRKDLITGMQSFITLRGAALQQAVARQGVDMTGIDISHPLDSIRIIAKKVITGKAELLKGRDAKGVASEVADFVVKEVKAQFYDVESARKAYRNHTAKTRERTDSLSLAADKLTMAMKSATTLKDGVKIGAECMALKRGVRAMATKLTERESFLDEMQALMKGNGLTIDERTTFDKLKALDKMTVVETAADLYSSIKSVTSLLAMAT